MSNYFLPVYPTNEEFFFEENALYYLKPQKEIPLNHSDYLYNEFLLQREDFMYPLRNNVKHFREKREIMKDLFVYTNPRLERMKISLNSLNISLTAYVYEAPNTFIYWDRTQRMKSFQLLLISNQNVTKIIQALLVNRENIQPDYEEFRLIEFEIRLLDEGKDFQTFLDMIDQDDCIIMEPRSYFEGTRHYLNRLKDKILLGPDKKFNLPFHENLLSQEAQVNKPEYLWEEQYFMEVFYSFDDRPQKVNVMEPWFEDVKEQDIDPSQMRALHNIFSKRVSLVQGPPGTGKTYCGALAIKTLLHNRQLIGDGPILIVCQTNHALDQFLNELNEFLPMKQMSRLGSRSKSEKIQEIIFKGQQAGRPNFQFGQFRHMMDSIQDELDKLFPSAVELPFEVFFQTQKQWAIYLVTDYFDVFEIILRPELVTQKICEKMYDIWKNYKIPEFAWIEEICQELQLHPAQIRMIENFCYSLSAQEKFEKFKESIRDPYKYRNINNFAATFHKQEYRDDDEELDEASDEEDEKYYEEFKNRQFQKQAFPNSFDFQVIYEHIRQSKQNIWSTDIYSRHQILLQIQRPSQYNFNRLLNMLQEFYLERERLGKAFDRRDKKFLNEKQVIGMTATFAARQSRMLQMLDSKIMMIEEAGEILNASNLALLHKDIEHLILIGDHQQLQPKILCNYLKYAGFPTISMFERLVNNNVEHVTLEQQRRMKPILSQIVRLIYPKYINHPVVKEKAKIKIPELIDELLFFQHQEQERLDAINMSYQNEFEARMILEFVQYLQKLGVDEHKITILSFYSQQIFLLRKIIQETRIFVKVTTVDNYQGEENDYIFLSTVRSNDHGSIGFLSDVNRLCVAFSRARLGLFVFGNFLTIKKWLQNQQYHLWKKILDIAEQKEFMQEKIQILCPRHDKIAHNIRGLADWDNVKRTCRSKCSQPLRCGLHKCPEICHLGTCPPCKFGQLLPCGHMGRGTCNSRMQQNQDQDDEICYKRCEKILSCGHQCASLCSSRCRCSDQDCSTIEVN